MYKESGMRVPVDIPQNQWKLVAENVKSGFIDVVLRDYLDYSFDYVLTGQNGPENDITAVSFHSRQQKIGNTEFVDVYVKCKYDGRVIVST